MEDLEREVPHGEDDDEGDEASEDQNHDLLEPFVEREQHPLRARPTKSLLPLHRRSSEPANRPPDSDEQTPRPWRLRPRPRLFS